jgi:hypothetical protein
VQELQVINTPVALTDLINRLRRVALRRDPSPLFHDHVALDRSTGATPAVGRDMIMQTAARFTRTW